MVEKLPRDQRLDESKERMFIFIKKLHASGVEVPTSLGIEMDDIIYTVEEGYYDQTT